MALPTVMGRGKAAVPYWFGVWVDRLSVWQLALIFCCFFAGITWLGILVVHRVTRRLPYCKQPFNELVIHIAGTLGLIYIVLFGLLTVALDQTQRELHQVEARRATLAARVSEIEADLGQYKARLEEAAKRLQRLSVERDTAVSAMDRLLARLGALDQRHSASEISWPQALIPVLQLVTLIKPEVDLSGSDTLDLEAVMTDAPPEPDRHASGVTEPGRLSISELARVLASTGLNIQRLFSQFGFNHAQGGPFVPPPKGDQPSGIDSNNFEGMRGLIKSLPLSVPLEDISAREPVRPAARSIQSTAIFSCGARFVGALFVTDLCHRAGDSHLCRLSG